MFISRQAATASRPPTPRESSSIRQLSAAELSAVVGGQQQDASPWQRLSDQAVETGKALADATDPWLRVAGETFKLANEAGSYTRYLVEHIDSHSISWEEGARRDAEQHEAHDQAQKAEDSRDLYRGNRRVRRMSAGCFRTQRLGSTAARR
jgi:hypothetical protein